MTSQSNPLATSSQKFYKPSYNAGISHGLSQAMHGGPPTNNEKVQNFKREVREQMEFRKGNQNVNDQGVVIQGPSSMPKYKAILVEKFRSKLQQKGSRGLIAL